MQNTRKIFIKNIWQTGSSNNLIYNLCFLRAEIAIDVMSIELLQIDYGDDCQLASFRADERLKQYVTAFIII